ncbi:hypothetical protein AB6D11_02550 [Vibrio splendidus]
MTTPSNAEHYTLRTNVGTGSTPLYLTLDLGEHDDFPAANVAANKKVKDCEVPMKWSLMCGQTDTGYTYNSEPSSPGFTLVATVTGATEDDLKTGLEGIMQFSDCREGSFQSNDFSYAFTKHGTEHRPIVLLDSPTVIIMDGEELIARSDLDDFSEDDVQELFDEAGQEGSLLPVATTQFRSLIHVYELNGERQERVLLEHSDVVVMDEKFNIKASGDLEDTLREYRERSTIEGKFKEPFRFYQPLLNQE